MSSSDRERLRAALMEHMAGAAREVRLILSRDPPEQEYVQKHLRAYILHKYMLPEDACPGGNIRELTDASLARMMKVSPELVKDLDTARSCAGATSATVKKALLFQAMEREFGVILPADRAVAAPDVAALAALLLQCMAAKQAEA